MGPTFRHRHQPACENLSPAEVAALLASARSLQSAAAAGRPRPLLRGKNLGLLCDDDAQRDAMLFRRAATELGARVAHIRNSLDAGTDSQRVLDTARMLGRPAPRPGRAARSRSGRAGVRRHRAARAPDGHAGRPARWRTRERRQALLRGAGGAAQLDRLTDAAARGPRLPRVQRPALSRERAHRRRRTPAPARRSRCAGSG